jgi:hypothetical protein
MLTNDNIEKLERKSTNMDQSHFHIRVIKMVSITKMFVKIIKIKKKIQKSHMHSCKFKNCTIIKKFIITLMGDPNIISRFQNLYLINFGIKC